LDELLGWVAGRFGRVEPRRRARAFVLGLLADPPRKNCWTIAEHAGQATPEGMQHLVAGAVEDEHAVRDDVRAYLFLKASPYELRLRRARIRSMATNAMPTVITAIHRAGAPMPATSMTAPMTINATAIQMMGFMATPPLLSMLPSEGLSETRVDFQNRASQGHSSPIH
jgi:hypothetical protein